MKDVYMVTFTFVENGHECRTSWTGAAASREDAIAIAEDWFGFKKDGIKVLKTEVT